MMKDRTVRIFSLNVPQAFFVFLGLAIKVIKYIKSLNITDLVEYITSRSRMLSYFNRKYFQEKKKKTQWEEEELFKIC